MRTTTEIAAEVERANKADAFGFYTSTLLGYLPFKDAKPFLKEGATAEEWSIKPATPVNVKKDMGSYIDFAVGKVLGHRGISASRSIAHYQAWLWLLDDEEGQGWCEDDGMYQNYGAPVLKAIAEKYGFKMDLTLGEGEMFERMAKGKPCVVGCGEGCGSSDTLSSCINDDLEASVPALFIQCSSLRQLREKCLRSSDDPDNSEGYREAMYTMYIHLARFAERYEERN